MEQFYYRMGSRVINARPKRLTPRQFLSNYGLPAKAVREVWEAVDPLLTLKDLLRTLNFLRVYGTSLERMGLRMQLDPTTLRKRVARMLQLMHHGLPAVRQRNQNTPCRLHLTLHRYHGSEGL